MAAAAAAVDAAPRRGPPPPAEDGVEHAGWALRSVKGPISSEAERDALEAEVGIQALPEMVFGANRLRLEHAASGFALEFRADHALRGCRTDAAGGGAGGAGGGAGGAGGAGGGGQITVTAAGAGATWEQRLAQHPDAQKLEVNYDWTFSTRYAGSSGAAAGGGAGWVEDPEAQLDMELLQRRDPILWSSEVYLFEDELHDNGVSLLSARVRVMPTCFLVLLRHWLRVDDVLVRVRDCRVFHDFSKGRVLRECTERGGTFEELRARGLPSGPRDYLEATPPLVARLPLKGRRMEAWTVADA